jgi:acetyl esterase/lipase
MPSDTYKAALDKWIDWNRSVDLAAPIDSQRRSYEEMFVRTAPPSPDVIIDEVLADSVPAEWTHTRESTGKVIVFFHGGGFLVGSKRACRGFAGQLSAATRRRVFSIDYRLSPENPHPAALDDAMRAYRWLLEQKVAPADIVLAGESAGGGLAVATMMALRDSGVPLPACAVLISPWLDLAVTGDSAKPGASDDPLVSVATLRIMARLYAGEDTRAPLASPLYGNLAGLPPMLLMAGAYEMLRDDATRFVSRATQAGVRAELHMATGMVHIWPLIAPASPEAADALIRVRQFVADQAVLTR